MEAIADAERSLEVAKERDREIAPLVERMQVHGRKNNFGARIIAAAERRGFS